MSIGVAGDSAVAELEPAAAPLGPTAGSAAAALSATPPPTSPLAVLPRRGKVRAVAAMLRPRQWIKNGLVVAAAGAAGALGHDDVPVRVFLACLAFCLLASGIYAVNDARDAEEDRQHPRKRFRPVAARELSPVSATGVGIALMAAGLGLCAAIRPLLALVGLGYLALTVSYTLIWRSIVILDVVAIGGGFVLRAVAGGVAAPVALSRWFLLVISAAAVLVAAGKRAAELRRARGQNAAGRRVLSSYPPWLLKLILAGSAAIALVAYCVWAYKHSGAQGLLWRELTILPFGACLLRYGILLRAGAGEAPEELVLTDRPLQLAGIVWLVLFSLSVSAGG